MLMAPGDTDNKGTSLDLLGGGSAYCINESQLTQAYSQYESDDDSGQRIRDAREKLADMLSPREQAVLAMVLIDMGLKGVLDG